MSKKTPKAPKLMPNGLKHGQYSLLGKIDRSIEYHGAGLFVEVVNGIQRKEQLAWKVAHAVDAKRFFKERNHDIVKAMVICVEDYTSIEVESPSLDSQFVVPEFNPTILKYMLYCGPRLVHFIRSNSPYNADFYDRRFGGIAPRYQQLIYHVIREAVNNDINPDDILQGSTTLLSKGGISLPESDDEKSLNTLLSNCRGTFLEMYAASCWMYALQDHDYDFFRRIIFPMWDSAHLNGEPLADGMKVVTNQRKKVAEIDLVFALPEKAYHEGLERVLNL